MLPPVTETVSLRRRCPNAADESDFTRGAGLTLEALRAKREYHEKTWTKCCNGRGWVPVDEYKALYVLLEWMDAGDVLVTRQYGTWYLDDNEGEQSLYRAVAAMVAETEPRKTSK